MQTLQFERPGRAVALRSVIVGCVGSGDLEVMLEPGVGSMTTIDIKTSVSGSEVRWRQVLDLIESNSALPLMRMDIHDFGATPGVIRLRIEQAIEKARETEAQEATE
ncbi:MAG: malonate decarboxylase acyl carrier protein [Marinobacter sp.]|nr:malonate decarboxylase acyl carrier protein [Marinobacter sp.]